MTSLSSALRVADAWLKVLLPFNLQSLKLHQNDMDVCHPERSGAQSKDLIKLG